MTAAIVPRRRVRSWVGALAFLFFGNAGVSEASSMGAGYSTERFDRVLSRFADASGRVDYAGLAREREDLDAFCATLAEVSPDSHPGTFPSGEFRLAYWINAYNATVLRLVLDHYPISSVQEVPAKGAGKLLPDGAGFFVGQKIILGGKRTNLYALENRTIRKRFSDPRFHFALNCASLGCPKLPVKAFSAADLDAELETETRRFIGEDKNVRVDKANRTVWLSSIFKWYRKDFVSWLNASHFEGGATLVRYVELYSDGEKALALEEARLQSYRVEFVPYDWGLNSRRD